MTTAVLSGDLRGETMTRTAMRTRSRAPRVRVTTVTRPRVDRRHPSAPAGRPSGAPAPALSGLGPVVVAPLAPGGAWTHGGLPVGGAARARTGRAVHRPVVRPAASHWRLTDRGIALVLAVFAVLMVASMVTVVGKVLQVTAPDAGYAATR